MSALADMVRSFVKTFEPQSRGITEEGNVVFEFERYSWMNPDFRVHIIVDRKIEDYDEALRKALEDENYEKAEKINQIINKRNDPGRKDGRIEGNSSEGEEPEED